jgi:hypothetical protein
MNELLYIAPGVLETDDDYGPGDQNYFSYGSGAHWFRKWFPGTVPRSGWKLHVAPLPDDAEAVARCVLPRLRYWRIPHKVIRSLERYVEYNEKEDQAGKFITIYTGNANEANIALRVIDPPLARLVQAGTIRRTPFRLIPTTRASNHQEAEHAVSQSGLVFVRYFDDDDPDVA